jgi:hypothetical protein
MNDALVQRSDSASFAVDERSLKRISKSSFELLYNFFSKTSSAMENGKVLSLLGFCLKLHLLKIIYFSLKIVKVADDLILSGNRWKSYPPNLYEISFLFLRIALVCSSPIF